MGWMTSFLVMVPLVYARQRLEEEVYEGLVRRGMPGNDIPELLYGPGYTGLHWSHHRRRERLQVLRVAAEVVPESRFAWIVQREDSFRRGGLSAVSWILDWAA